MPDRPRLAEDAYNYNEAEPIERSIYTNAKRLKGYPHNEQDLYDRRLAKALCVELGEITQRGEPKAASLREITTLLCNYLYRACDKLPDEPHKFIFHYSCNKSFLVLSKSGMSEHLIYMVNLLAKREYIEDNRQTANEGYKTRKESTFNFTPSFVALIERLELCEAIANTPKPDDGYKGREFQDDNFISIRLNSPTLSTKENQKAVKFPADLTAPPRLDYKRRINAPLKKYNKLLTKAEFKLAPLTAVRDAALITNELKERHASYDTYNFKDKLRVERRYADEELKTHGRLYGGFWQSMPSQLRNLIMIDNYYTVELDYSAMQPNILFGFTNEKPLFEDVYRVPRYDEEAGQFRDDIPPFERQLIKDCFMLLINSKKPKKTFISNILSRLRGELELEKDCFDERGDNTRLDMLYNKHLEWQAPEFRSSLKASLEQAWNPIWGIIGDDYDWRALTHLDSEVAFGVIKDLTNKGIPILPIHDSFIVQGNKVDILYEAMNRAYQDVVKPKNGVVPFITHKHLLVESKFTISNDGVMCLS